MGYALGMMEIIEKGNFLLDKFEEDTGVGRERLSDLRNAVEYYTRAITLGCGEAEAYGNRAAAYNWLSEYDKAFADICRAIELEPSNGVYLFNRGVSYAEKENWERAFIDFFDAIKSDSSLREIVGSLYEHRFKKIRADGFYRMLQNFTAEFGKDIFEEKNFRPLLLDFSKGEYRQDIKTLMRILELNILKEFKRNESPEAVRKRVFKMTTNESGRMMDILCCLLLYDDIFEE